ncbi:ABC transporter permease [Alkalispirochaeta alkalica]|uniref:ABC transporter permease n=1 Tax=Alkalispirochaeta alkalica TaxID=46356 RepID=UPI00037C7957|nr:ABC transporter permease [Alkalispirochaeta alkalica]
MIFETVGSRVFATVQDFFYAMGYCYRVLRETVLFFLKKRSRQVLTLQILFTGVEALPVIALLSLGLGAIIIVQGVTLLPQFGQGELVYAILITVITRELGPILTAFIVTARSGTAISTELGNMVVSHEIEAYVANGIDPISYLVVPRFLGVVVSVVLLNLYFNLFGLLGSFLVTSLITTIHAREYFSNLLNALILPDIAISLAKSIASGAIISLVATYYGFKVEQSSTEVPVMAIRSVGRGFTLIITVNMFLTIIYYLWI